MTPDLFTLTGVHPGLHHQCDIAPPESVQGEGQGGAGHTGGPERNAAVDFLIVHLPSHLFGAAETESKNALGPLFANVGDVGNKEEARAIDPYPERKVAMFRTHHEHAAIENGAGFLAADRYSLTRYRDDTAAGFLDLVVERGSE